MMDWVRHPSHMMPAAVREHLTDWWEAVQGGPLVELCVELDADEAGEEEQVYLQAIASLMPVVRSTVFTTSPAIEKLALQLRIPAARRPDSQSPLADMVRFLRDHHVSPPLFYGILTFRTAFPDARALISTIYGVAADIHEHRLPRSVLLVGRGRQASSFGEAQVLLQKMMAEAHGSPVWESLNQQLQELVYEPSERHDMVFMTPPALNWGSTPGVDDVRCPAHVVAVAQDWHAHLADEVPAARVRGAAVMARQLGSLAMVDITDTVHLIRWPDRKNENPDPCPGDIVRDGRVVKSRSADNAVLATAQEDDGHVVVGVRGSVVDLDAEELPQEEQAPAESPTGGTAPKEPPAPRPEPPPQKKEPEPAEKKPPPPSRSRERPGPLLTVFTTFFAKDTSEAHGLQKYLIQKNTVLALQYMAPEVEVIVFSKDEQIKTMGKELGVPVWSEFQTNPYGTPLLKSMFQTVEKHTKAPFFGYTNGDILFGTDLLQTLRATLSAVEQGRLRRRLLIVGRRTNFAMPFPLRDESEWMLRSRSEIDRKLKAMAARGRLFQTDAEDFFFITPGSFDWNKIPNFVIGRVAYDNWLVDHAYHDGLDRIDVTRTARAVHQTGVDGNKAGHIVRPDKTWNEKLGRGQYDHGQTTHCNYETRWVGPGVILHDRGIWHPRSLGRSAIQERKQALAARARARN